MMANTRVRTRDRKRVNPVKYTFRCELRRRRGKHVINKLGNPSIGHDCNDPGRVHRRGR